MLRMVTEGISGAAEAVSASERVVRLFQEYADAAGRAQGAPAAAVVLLGGLLHAFGRCAVPAYSVATSQSM